MVLFLVGLVVLGIFGSGIYVEYQFGVVQRLKDFVSKKKED